jgi:hypothetical protein
MEQDATVKHARKFDPNAIDYVLSDQIANLDYLVGHDPKAAEAFFGNAPPHRPSSTSYFSTIEFLCWRFQSTFGPYARIFSSKLTFVTDCLWGAKRTFRSACGGLD